MNIVEIKKHLLYEDILKYLHTGVQSILFAQGLLQSVLGQQFNYVFYIKDGNKKAFIRKMKELFGVQFYQHFKIPNKMWYGLVDNMCYIDEDGINQALDEQKLKLFKDFHRYYKIYKGYENE